jgi:class 3 adenylate cyclase
MAQEGFKRKLIAILSANAVGYSRLMRDDEEATVRDIAARRALIIVEYKIICGPSKKGDSING